MILKASNNILPSHSQLPPPWHTTLLFVHQLHRAPSVSYHQSFTEAARRCSGKCRSFQRVRRRREDDNRIIHPPETHTYTQIWETSAYYMQQVASLNHVFLLYCSFQALPQKKKKNQLLMTYSPTFLPEPIIASNFKLKLAIHATQMSIV